MAIRICKGLSIANPKGLLTAQKQAHIAAREIAMPGSLSYSLPLFLPDDCQLFIKLAIQIYYPK